MSERSIESPQQFVTCHCEHCGGGIEFDASDFAKDEIRAVECPHCKTETTIFVPPILSDNDFHLQNAREVEREEEIRKTGVPAAQDNPAAPINLETVHAQSGSVPPVISDESVDLNSKKFFQRVEDTDAKFAYDLGIVNFRQKDYSNAARCFEKAAKMGHHEAQYHLGNCYMEGSGVGIDEAEAVKWFSKAAEKGHVAAQYSLGVAYFLGKGVPENFSSALKWLHMAAEQGNDDAQFMLGLCYESGEGVVARNYVEAYKWMKRAAARRHDGAHEKCEEIVLKMNGEQIKAVEPHHQKLWKRERLTLKRLSDFIGQKRIKARLELAFAAAKHRGESLNHILLIGSPGSGKATLANVIAKVICANIKITSGPTITKAADLAGPLTNLEAGDVLFIDEIHRLPRIVEEYLYPATKDFQLDIIVDQGPNARSVRLNLPRFTLIGSTTARERLTPNLLSCFRVIENMDDYSIEELAAIVRRFATAFEVEIDADAIDRIARSADGTPLDVLNRLQHVRDFAHVKGNGNITPEIAEAALQMLASSDEKQAPSEGRDSIPSAVRREVWRRDGGKCARCGSRKNLEYDHIIPVSKGGSNTARNIELLCEEHNRAKSDLIQ